MRKNRYYWLKLWAFFIYFWLKWFCIVLILLCFNFILCALAKIYKFRVFRDLNFHFALLFINFKSIFQRFIFAFGTSVYRRFKRIKALSLNLRMMCRHAVFKILIFIIICLIIMFLISCLLLNHLLCIPFSEISLNFIHRINLFI